MSNAATPVVVLNCFRHGGLGIVRSLGRMGVPVYAVHRDGVAPALYSRYCTKHLTWDVDTASPEANLNFLKDVAERIGRRAILLPTSDIGALFVADNGDRLSKWYDFPKQDPAMMRAVSSKLEMYHLAKKWNVPTPETTVPLSRADIEKFLETARFPVLLKPVKSGPTAPAMRLLHNRAEVLEAYAAVEDPATANIILQEYIPGDDKMTFTFNGYFDRSGECKVAFTGRKLRNYLPYFGQASLGMCMHNQRVLDTTIAFMKAIGYHGPLDVGFRYDARDDQYKVNDINPRVGAMFRCFVGANGMDVVRAMYQDMTGQEVTPSSTQEGRKWIVEDRDWISAIRYWRDGNLTVGGYIDSIRGVKELSFFAADDLRPLLGVGVMASLAAWGSLTRLIRGKPSPAPQIGGQRVVL